MCLQTPESDVNTLLDLPPALCLRCWGTTAGPRFFQTKEKGDVQDTQAYSHICTKICSQDDHCGTTGKTNALDSPSIGAAGIIS